MLSHSSGPSTQMETLNDVNGGQASDTCAMHTPNEQWMVTASLTCATTRPHRMAHVSQIRARSSLEQPSRSTTLNNHHSTAHLRHHQAAQDGAHVPDLGVHTPALVAPAQHIHLVCGGEQQVQVQFKFMTRFWGEMRLQLSTSTLSAGASSKFT